MRNFLDGREREKKSTKTVYEYDSFGPNDWNATILKLNIAINFANLYRKSFEKIQVAYCEATKIIMMNVPSRLLDAIHACVV